jgi:antitoxin component of RelBE/YafQ-DinJ toxin-antitoxin module
MPENIVYANLGIDEKVYSRFKEICDKKGLKYGKQVEIMMEKFNNKVS